MAKKKQPYFLFLKSLQAKDRQNGVNRDLSHYQAKANELWNAMSHQERRPWIDRANKANLTTTVPVNFNGGEGRQSRAVSESQACLMEAVNLNDQALQEVDVLKRSCDLVNHVLNGIPVEELLSKKFFIVSSNVMVVTMEKDYYPVELGIMSYNLVGGIEAKMHDFVNPGPVPTGYMYKAKSHCEATHKIPLVPLPEAIPFTSEAYETLLTNITIFINDSKVRIGSQDKYVLFAHGDQCNQVYKCFEYLASRSNSDDFIKLFDEGRFSVIDLAVLLKQLLEVSGSPSTLFVCQDALNKVAYDFCPGSCDFHEEIDNNYCALGFARRLLYKFSDHVLPSFGITPVPDKHLPVVDDSAIRCEAGPLMDEELYPRRSAGGSRSVAGSVLRDVTSGSWDARSVTSNDSRFNPEDRLRDVMPVPGIVPSDPRRTGGIGRGVRPN